MTRLVSIAAAVAMLALPLQAQSGKTDTSEESREWRFRVSLNDKEIGSQRFQLRSEDGLTRLETEAQFDVKILLATIYRYEHRNVEIWEDGCLVGIESSTDANGDPFFVSGRRQEGFFAVEATTGAERLPECVMTFAYWNPRFLESPRLLNTQNGEYVEVEVSEPVPDQRRVRGRLVPALRYRLTAGDIDMKLWYSLEDDWLGLESKTQGNRTLRYELM